MMVGGESNCMWAFGDGGSGCCKNRQSLGFCVSVCVCVCNRESQTVMGGVDV